MHPDKTCDMESRSHTTFAKRRTFPLVSYALCSKRLPHPPHRAAGTVLRTIACLLMLVISLFFGSSIALAGSSSNALVVSPTSLNQSSTQCTADGSPNYTYHCAVRLGLTTSSHGKISWTSSSSLSGVVFTPASGSLKPGQTVSVKIASIPCKAGGTSGSFTFSGPKGATPATSSWNCMPPPPTFTVNPSSLDPTNANCALDAPLSATYKCTATLGETAGSQGNANWTTSSSLSGVTFIPASGTLQPAGSATVTIDQIPCQNGTFTFSGKEGETPVTVAWSCTPPTLTVSPTSLNNTMCGSSQNAFQCTVTLGESSTSQGNVNWTASSDLSGVSFSPASGTLAPGQSATVTISSIPCQKGTFTFNGSGGASPVSVTWTCANWGLLGYDAQNTRYNPLENRLSASNVSGLVVDWRDPLGVGGDASPVVVNTMAYITDATNGYLDALNSTTGALVWRYYVLPPTNISPAVANGIVYVGGTNYLGGLYAFNATTGALLWHVGSSPTFTPTVSNGVVYVGVDDGNLGPISINAYDAATGNLLWSAPHIGANYAFMPAVDNGVVYASGYDTLYALDATTGAVKWSYNPRPGIPSISSAPAVGNGEVFIVAYYSLTALNETTGAVLWSIGPSNSSFIANANAPAIANGIVYTQMDNGNSPGISYVQAFNASTGVVLWSTYVGGNSASSHSAPAIANGVVYVGLDSNVVLALDATNGTQLWSYTTGYHVNSSPAVVNGVLYIGSDDGNLYAFHLPGTNAKPTATRR